MHSGWHFTSKFIKSFHTRIYLCWWIHSDACTSCDLAHILLVMAEVKPTERILPIVCFYETQKTAHDERKTNKGSEIKKLKPISWVNHNRKRLECKSETPVLLAEIKLSWIVRRNAPGHSRHCPRHTNNSCCLLHTRISVNYSSGFKAVHKSFYLHPQGLVHF